MQHVYQTPTAQFEHDPDFAAQTDVTVVTTQGRVTLSLDDLFTFVALGYVKPRCRLKHIDDNNVRRILLGQSVGPSIHRRGRIGGMPE